jgi:hypothetical protein
MAKKRVRQKSKGRLADSRLAVSPLGDEIWDEKMRETAKCLVIKGEVSYSTRAEAF